MKLNNKTIIIIGIVIIIIILVIGIKNKSSNDEGTPIDPLTDIREYMHSGLEISEEEVPKEILTNSKNIISNFEKNLNNSGVNNVKIAKIQDYIDDKNNNNYVSIYLIIDKDLNKKTARILLFHKNNGDLSKIRMDLNDRNQEETIIYNKSVIDVDILNISSDVKEKISNGLKENYEQEAWRLGTAYTYESIDDGKSKIIFYYFSNLS